jgi:phosphoglycerate dehydrogenase-like enzyme
MKVAILDDYQNAALESADWAPVTAKAEITVFTDHLEETGPLIERLAPFDVVCVMRERTPLSREVLQRLPRLKLIASTGPVNASIDLQAVRERGIAVTNTGYGSTPAIELTWALILAATRHLVQESNSMRGGGWQTALGRELRGRTLGIVGLGNVGSEVARIGLAFGMTVVAWSQNLTAEKAAASGAKAVSREQLFGVADIVSIHLISSARTRGLIGARDLALMKATSILVNTSRGEIVDEVALVSALEKKAIGGAALDVFQQEPLPANHPLRRLSNVLATPHIGFVAEDLYRTFYGDAAASIAAWLESAAGREGSP